MCVCFRRVQLSGGIRVWPGARASVRSHRLGSQWRVSVTHRCQRLTNTQTDRYTEIIHQLTPRMLMKSVNSTRPTAGVMKRAEHQHRGAGMMKVSQTETLKVLKVDCLCLSLSVHGRTRTWRRVMIWWRVNRLLRRFSGEHLELSVLHTEHDNPPGVRAQTGVPHRLSRRFWRPRGRSAPGIFYLLDDFGAFKAGLRTTVNVFWFFVWKERSRVTLDFGAVLT